MILVFYFVPFVLFRGYSSSAFFLILVFYFVSFVLFRG